MKLLQQLVLVCSMFSQVSGAAALPDCLRGPIEQRMALIAHMQLLHILLPGNLPADILQRELVYREEESHFMINKLIIKNNRKDTKSGKPRMWKLHHRHVYKR